MSLKNIKEKMFSISITLMFMLPLFPPKFRPFLIGLFSLCVALSLTNQRFEFNTKKFLINGFVYLFIVLSLLYSDNLGYAGKKLETMSSLIIFPFIFSILPTHKVDMIYKKKDFYMFTYIMSVVALNLSFFIYHFWHYGTALFSHFITVTRISQGDYNIHPIYLSMHICVAIIFTFFLFKSKSKSKSKSKTVVLLFAIIILLFFLYLQLKKGPIIGLGIAFLIFIFLQKNRQLWVVYFSALLIAIIAIMSSPKLKTKFGELLTIESIEEGNLTSTNVRYSIYHYALEVINKSPIIGHGIGDYNDELIKVYNEKSVLNAGKYNAHNQYLSFLISIGVIGLLSFIIMIGYNLIYAIMNNNQELILLLVFYCFVMSFENILEREDGVLFFSFFVGIFSLFSNKAYCLTVQPRIYQ